MLTAILRGLLIFAVGAAVLFAAYATFAASVYERERRRFEERKLRLAQKAIDNAEKNRELREWLNRQEG